MNIQEIMQVLQGRYIGEVLDKDIKGAMIDSRQAISDSIFFCITGNTVDGHAYIEDAARNGAILAVVEKEVLSPIPCICVDDVVTALGTLARYKRSHYPHVVIAITGSCGKTTAKEMLSHILAQYVSVSKNTLNYNNHIGMPLSILNADSDASVWVLELGISEAYDMALLGSIAQPTIVYITNAGNAHIEGLCDKGVAYHKASLIQYMSTQQAILNSIPVVPMVYIPQSAEELIKEAKQYTQPITLVNTVEPVNVHYVGVDKGTTYGKYTIAYEDYSVSIAIPYRGAFIEETLSICIRIALSLGMEIDAICTALISLPSIEHRNCVIQYGESYIIDDTYNANPISMRAMIESAYSYSAEHYILFLGDMKELGKLTIEEHRALGAYIACKSTTAKTSLLWKGTYGLYIYQGLMSSSFVGAWYENPSSNTVQSVIQEVPSWVMLCKASRSVTLEHELQEIYAILGVKDCDI